MKRTGISELPLHGGKAPPWLIDRMKKLTGPIVEIVIDDYGRDEFLRRLSNPTWFQALGCVLGYDWHSSGLTTVTTGVLKDVLDPEKFGIFGAGGKGKISLRTPQEIENFSGTFGFSPKKIEHLQYASRMSAKVDNAAIQAGAPLYHHAFFVTEEGKWTVIQQGMNVQDKTARRYHWLSDGVESFVDEPHEAILAERRKSNVLDMTAKNSKECKKTGVDLVRDDPDRVRRDFKSLRPKGQRTLPEWIPGLREKDRSVRVTSLPKRMNWKALEEACQLQPENYEKLLDVDGIGPATVRGLALVSEVIHGNPASWKDPAKFSFAFGGKDGVPYPVDKKAMDEAHETLESAIEEAELGKREKIEAIKRLGDFTSPDT